MTMEIKIVTSKENPLLKRREIQFKIEHGPQSKTPARMDVKKALAAELKIGEELIFVKDMRTLTGMGTRTLMKRLSKQRRLSQSTL
jgi:small subunit ribosomal protein S24e